MCYTHIYVKLPGAGLDGKCTVICADTVFGINCNWFCKNGKNAIKLVVKVAIVGDNIVVKKAKTEGRNDNV